MSLSSVCLSVITLQLRLEKGGPIRTDPPSSGSVEALVGITRMSVQFVGVAVVLDVFDALAVVAAIVGVTFLVHLHLIHLHLMHLHLMHLHLVHLHLIHLHFMQLHLMHLYFTHFHFMNLHVAFLLFLQFLVSPVITGLATLN